MPLQQRDSPRCALFSCPTGVTQSRRLADSHLVLFSSPNPIDPDEPLTRFLEMLPPLPTTVTRSTPRWARPTLLLATVDRGKLIGYGPQSLMEDGLDLVVELRDEHGAGRDVLLQVTKSFYQVDGQTMLYLNVVGFENRAGKREVSRTPLDGDAYATVLWSSRLPVGDRGARVAGRHLRDRPSPFSPSWPAAPATS